ncbi:MAG TPA: hypothetical protein VNT31_13535 [Nocardioides sp.]|nr:hypothetical protein [Nocardioides sp.]
MDIAGVIVIGIVVAIFIAGGLLWSFVADRRRNEQVAHDPERLDPDPNPGSDPRLRHDPSAHRFDE